MCGGVRYIQDPELREHYDTVIKVNNSFGMYIYNVSTLCGVAAALWYVLACVHVTVCTLLTCTFVTSA